MGQFSLGHWIIVGIILLFFLGRTNLASLGRNLGRGIKGFKDSLNEVDADSRPVDELTHEEEASKA